MNLTSPRPLPEDAGNSSGELPQQALFAAIVTPVLAAVGVVASVGGCDGGWWWSGGGLEVVTTLGGDGCH